jgi:adenine-specific DNA-methyltransferase
MATRITTKSVETLKHDEAKRKNIPSAEQQSFASQEQTAPKQIRYPRNTDLDPQLVWRGKDEQDWSDLVVNAPPLYIQEKVHPKVLIDDLLRTTKEREHEAGQTTADLFSDFNGIPKGVDKTEFYQHDQNWTNRMILGDSLQVMASLAEREGLRGKVQCIYFDPPYGIKFNSNFQWSTTSRDVKDGKADHITREPEQVKAFRDTWRDGIHSYLTYLRDRLTVARDLLTESGSIFVQIGMRMCTGFEDPTLLPSGSRVLQATALQSTGFSESLSKPIDFQGKSYTPNSNSHWKTTIPGLGRLALAQRIQRSGNTVRYVRFIDDFGVSSLGNMWTDLMGSQQMIYVVQTNTRVVERCIQMATDPGDLVLDPTCGSGTTATVAEQWGRRWITIDTSRVALPWLVPASWAHAIRFTCWPIRVRARSRRPKSPARPPAPSRCRATSATGLFMSACRTSP